MNSTSGTERSPTCEEISITSNNLPVKWWKRTKRWPETFKPCSNSSNPVRKTQISFKNKSQVSMKITTDCQRCTSKWHNSQRKQCQPRSTTRSASTIRQRKTTIDGLWRGRGRKCCRLTEGQCPLDSNTQLSSESLWWLGRVLLSDKIEILL